MVWVDASVAPPGAVSRSGAAKAKRRPVPIHRHRVAGAARNQNPPLRKRDVIEDNDSVVITAVLVD